MDLKLVVKSLPSPTDKMTMDLGVIMPVVKALVPTGVHKTSTSRHLHGLILIFM